MVRKLPHCRKVVVSNLAYAAERGETVQKRPDCPNFIVTKTEYQGDIWTGKQR